MENSLISLPFYSEHSFFETQSESGSTLLLRRIQSDSSDSLDFVEIPLLLNTHVHTPNDSRPPLGPRMVHKASEMAKNDEKGHVLFFLENLPPLNFQKIVDYRPKNEGPTS